MDMRGQLKKRPQLKLEFSTHEKSKVTCHKKKAKKFKGRQYNLANRSIVDSGNTQITVKNSVTPDHLKALTKIVAYVCMTVSVSFIALFIGFLVLTLI